MPGREMRDMNVRRFGLDNAVDETVYSYQIGVLKPDPRAYQSVLQRLGAAPEHSVFVDDYAGTATGALSRYACRAFCQHVAGNCRPAPFGGSDCLMPGFGKITKMRMTASRVVLVQILVLQVGRKNANALQDQLSTVRGQFERDGYVMVRNVIDQDLVEEGRRHIEWLLEHNPGTRPEQLHHSLMTDDPFWVRLVSDDRLLDVAERFVGPISRCLRRITSRTS